MPRTDLQKAQVLLLKAEKEFLKIGKDFTNIGSINKKILFSVSALVSTAGILASKSLNSPAPAEYSAVIQSALN